MALSRPLGGRRIAVIGAGGYLGRSLLPVLLAAGARPLALAAPGETLSGLAGVDSRTVEGASAGAIADALAGADLAIELDGWRRRASATAHAARAAGCVWLVRVERIEPLGAAPPPLAVPFARVRLGPLLGAGSPWIVAMSRLVERLPLLPLPRWTGARVQPLALGDALRCLEALVACAPHDGDYDLGGADVVTYAELLASVGLALGRRRATLALPWPALGASRRLARAVTGRSVLDAELAAGEPADALARDDRLAVLAGVEPLGVDAALRAATRATRRRVRA